jgi:MerR family redox-sensitive transcriptional activator SoxR
MKEATMTIGEVAARAGVRASAIRYYERVGVLPPAERESGRRRYTVETVDRLGFIDVAQQAGFSLPEIRELLQESPDGDAAARLQALARAKLPEVEALIARATAMRNWLELATDCDCSTLDACALFTDPALRGEPVVRNAG